MHEIDVCPIVKDRKKKRMDLFVSNTHEQLIYDAANEGRANASIKMWTMQRTDEQEEEGRLERKDRRRECRAKPNATKTNQFIWLLHRTERRYLCAEVPCPSSSRAS